MGKRVEVVVISDSLVKLKFDAPPSVSQRFAEFGVLQHYPEINYGRHWLYVGSQHNPQEVAELIEEELGNKGA